MVQDTGDKQYSILIAVKRISVMTDRNYFAFHGLLPPYCVVGELRPQAEQPA
jgi:hypothetical protein